MDEGAHKPADAALRALYRRAFEEFGALALWSSRPVPEPTIADALAITESVAGNLAAPRAGGRPVQPAPSALDRTVQHAGARHGHWPASTDITAAMLERHGRYEPR
jgi:hypothetical protein